MASEIVCAYYAASDEDFVIMGKGDQSGTIGTWAKGTRWDYDEPLRGVTWDRLLEGVSLGGKCYLTTSLEQARRNGKHIYTLEIDVVGVERARNRHDARRIRCEWSRYSSRKRFEAAYASFDGSDTLCVRGTCVIKTTYIGESNGIVPEDVAMRVDASQKFLRSCAAAPAWPALRSERVDRW